MSEFDQFAKEYDEALERGISLSGESKDYFAAGRIRWLLKKIPGPCPRGMRIMDFGCGTGTSCPLLHDVFPGSCVVGVDPSADSLKVARELHGKQGVSFSHPYEIEPATLFDLVFCNGVFHHIPPEKRPETLGWIRGRIKPGGHFVMWENNPLNPGTQWVMHRIPFDRDAVKILPWKGRSMIAKAGFSIVSVTYQFVFPSLLRPFRSLEPRLSRLPLGAQYQVLATRR